VTQQLEARPRPKQHNNCPIRPWSRVSSKQWQKPFCIFLRQRWSLARSFRVHMTDCWLRLSACSLASTEAPSSTCSSRISSTSWIAKWGEPFQTQTPEPSGGGCSNKKDSDAPALSSPTLVSDVYSECSNEPPPLTLEALALHDSITILEPKNEIYPLDLWVFTEIDAGNNSSEILTPTLESAQQEFEPKMSPSSNRWHPRSKSRAALLQRTAKKVFGFRTEDLMKQ
jgi:hypothetical protein